jgi:hypothetical protein
MKRARSIFRELQNYFFLKKVIKREARNSDPTAQWNVFKLRANWFGRIYTIISLREEEMGEEEMVRNWIAMERMKPINDYLMGLGVHEIIFPSIEKIPDSRSYLIVYSPLFKETTLSWFIWRFLFLALFVTGTALLVKFN